MQVTQLSKASLLCLFLVGATLFSCNENENLEPVQQGGTENLSFEESLFDGDSLMISESFLDSLVSSSEIINTNARTNHVTYYKGWYNSEIVGCPNETIYYFIIRDNGQLRLPPKIKLYALGETRYYRMKRRGKSKKYWIAGFRTSLQGRVHWRYVDFYNKNLTDWNTYIDNTKVRIDLDGVSQLNWAFGSSRTGWFTTNEEGEGEHTGNDYYSYDYNWSNFDNKNDAWEDLGKPLYSPLDGKVTAIKKISNGSWVINIRQDYEDYYVTFTFVHINRTYVKKGDYVKAGTKVATLGVSGADSPHAHIALYYNGRTIPFEFSTPCN